MTKRKKTGSKKHSNALMYIAWGLVLIVVLLGTFIGAYYIGYDDAKKNIQKQEQMKEKKRLSVIKKLEQESAKKKEPDVNDRLKEILKKEAKLTEQYEQAPQEKIKDKHEQKIEEKIEDKVEESAKEYENSSHEVEGTVLPQPPERKIVKISTKPKLAIIIDDVSVKSHVAAIKGLNLPITMSFLPPSKFRPNSSILAAKESFYMVHLPMEAKNFHQEEPFTLRVNDSQEEIIARIEDIKKLFPKVKYINNHTGSKFTSDEDAVKRLIYALNKENINFIDSRTIASTKVQKVMKSYSKQYVARDVFLDDKVDKESIKAQIKKAIEVAKLHGSAIAIGHPHANTISSINEAKQLFSGVELVLIDKVY